ncbi:FAD-binding oxidoreductase [Natrinema versiforme]|uniref:FAD-binding oxidoreductase n=1 Tax=Natrinema versiforme TaxID=88724 RepID=A0A4P8WMY2_9EURY|nr:FAD-binding oxidoreductase [Natrinema versiforme]QCS44705.1 FAD-binding oxidoreductase [Natrinema versiforme]
MPERDVIVIGGGVAGMSCAYHLAAAGVEDVMVLEKDQPASKASGRAAGFITPDQFLSTGTHPEEHRYILEFWKDMARDSKIDPHYGDAYTFARNNESVSYLEELHERTEIDSRLLNSDEISEQIPDLITDNIELGFTFENGFSIDPYTATVTVMEKATALGTEVRTEPVTSITPLSQDETRITTPERTYTASVVIVAAGAWSKSLTRDIDISLPLKPRISQIITLDPKSEVDLPLINDPDLLLYYRREANGEVLIGGGTGKTEIAPSTFDSSVREEFLHEVAEKAPQISEKLREADVTGKWAGLCSATPDRHPLIGKIHSDGIYACCGFNGEGIMYSAVAGQLITDLVTETKSEFNVKTFDPDRFSSPKSDFEIRSAIEW